MFVYVKQSFAFALALLLFLLLSSETNGNTKGITGKVDLADRVQYRDGDILIGGLMMVTLPDGSRQCTNIQDTGIQGVETVNMIIDQLNKNKTILRGITLGTVLLDSCHHDAHALQKVLTNILPRVWKLSPNSCMKNSEKKEKGNLLAGVIGAAGSSVSIQVAKVLKVFEIPQVSYWSTSPDLSDKNEYKYFFRTVPSDKYQVEAIVQFIKSQNWNYISVVYEDTFYGVRGYTEISSFAEKNGICIGVAYSIRANAEEKDYKNAVAKLSEKRNARAVVLFTLQEDAKGIIKQAESSPDTAGYFCWVATDGWTAILPTHDDVSYEDGLAGTIGFKPAARRVPNFHQYFTSLTLNQQKNSSRNPWFADYISERNNCSLSSEKGRRKCSKNEHVNQATFSDYTIMQNIADSVLAFAHALDRYHRHVCQGMQVLCPALKAMVGTNQLATALYPYLRNLTFQGINGGEFSFDENQDAPAIYDIYRYDKDKVVDEGEKIDKWIRIGEFHVDHFRWNNNESDVSKIESTCSKKCAKNEAKIVESNVCCWTCKPCLKNEFVRNKTKCEPCPEGELPNFEGDGCMGVKIDYMDYKKPYGLVSLVCGLVGAILTFIVSMIHITHKDSAIVKASGKELCSFVLFGVLLTQSNSLAILAPPTYASCLCSRLILSFGPAFMYAGLLAKTMRVVIIFRSKILSPQVKLLLRPTSQIVLSCLIVLLQVFIVAIWFLINPPEAKILYPNFTSGFLACTNLVKIPILIGLVYPLLLILTCTILATLNRNVPTGFNETKLIGFTMYTTCVIWLAFLPMFITSDEEYDKKLVTTSICLSLSAFTVLLCLFGPRCFKILFRPEENTPESVMSSGVNTKRADKGSTSTFGAFPTGQALRGSSDFSLGNM